MMGEAVQNEQLASSQRLRNAYSLQLRSALETIQTQWQQQWSRAVIQADNLSPTESFAKIITNTSADGALVRDADGQIAYPNVDAPSNASPSSADPQWQIAEAEEFVKRDDQSATRLYSDLATQSTDPIRKAKARLAQARCLVRLGQTDGAIRWLFQVRDQPLLVDHQGRSLAATAETRLLDLIDPADPSFDELTQSLAARLDDYSMPMHSAQRQFLMSRLASIDGKAFAWRFQDAEAVSAGVASLNPATISVDALDFNSDLKLWMRTGVERRYVALYRTETLSETIHRMTEQSPLPAGVAYVVSSPDKSIDEATIVEANLGGQLDGWRLAIESNEDNLSSLPFSGRPAHYWITVLIVLATAALTWTLLGVLRRRLRVAKLKNDLVAMVSHELKTPLASIRLLVDTMLGDEVALTPEQNGQYLGLISQENARLTRLIDNFLTFSRIEKGNQRFDARPTEISDVIHIAAGVFLDHHADASDSLSVGHLDLASVNVDFDAMVTVIVNLLENAWKYSNDPRQICLSTIDDSEIISVAVRDNGIGISSRDAKRIFHRFYQVDQRACRDQGGCGLGLSIVSEIMHAHGGTIRVDSRLDAGSTFTITLPKQVGASEPTR